MKLSKKFISILLSVLVIASLFTTSIPYSAYSKEEYQFLDGCDKITENNVVYYVFEKAAMVVGCDKNATDIKIASSVNGVPVTRIDTQAFYENGKLVSVEMPDSVTYVGKDCFSGCSNLKSVRLSENITYIAEHMFSYCKSLKSVYLPEKITKICSSAFSVCTSLNEINISKVKVIQENAFDYCKALKKVQFGNALTKIGQSAFQGSGLVNVYISKNVKGIYTGATVDEENTSIWYVNSSFSFCKNLKNIKVSKDNKYFSSKDGVLYNKNKTTLLQYPCNGERNFTVPKTVTKIGQGAFDFSKIKSVKLSDKVNKIGTYAFSACDNLNRVNMNKGLKTIGAAAFRNCINLAKGVSSLKIPDSVEKIGDFAFNNCKNIKKIVLSKKLTKIGSCAFLGCKNAKSAVVYNKTKSIGVNALGYMETNSTYKKIKGFTITGSNGSVAEKYAKKNGFKFKKL